MNQLKDPSPKKKEPTNIDVVDVGFGRGERLKEWVQRPNQINISPRRFLGVERPGMKQEVDPDLMQASKQSDLLDLDFKGAIHALEKIPDESVNIVNADFLLSEQWLVQRKKQRGRPSYTELSHQDLMALSTLPQQAFPELPIPTKEEAKQIIASQRMATLSQIHRVLKPNGRFFLTELEYNLDGVVNLLDAAGFTCTWDDTPPQDMEKTETLKIVKEKLAEKNSQVKLQPIRITARKKRK